MTGCAPPPNASEPQRDVLAVDQVAGFWALLGPGDTQCDVSLANLEIDGVRPVLVERCGIAGLIQAKSWRATRDGFEILDGSGRVLMTFRRTGEDAFDAESGGFALRRAPVS